MSDILNNLALPSRLAAFAGIAVATHLLVILVRQLAQRAFLSQQVNRYQKLRSIATLTTSALVFSLYFLAVVSSCASSASR